MRFKISWLFGRRDEDADTISAHIYVRNGSRLHDPDAVEDFHANAVVSDKHRMAFRMRRPRRMFQMLRDGLAPVKIKSQQVYDHTELEPGYDLGTVIQMEAVFQAGLTGVDDRVDVEAAISRLFRIGAIVLGLALPVIALIARSRGGDDGDDGDAAAAAAIAETLLRGMGLL